MRCPRFPSSWGSPMLCRLFLLAAVAAVVAIPTPTPAAPPPNEEQETVARVNKAIDRGKDYLKGKYDKNSRWEAFWLNALGNMNGGVTALGTLALLTCGERPDDEPV